MKDITRIRISMEGATLKQRIVFAIGGFLTEFAIFRFSKDRDRCAKEVLRVLQKTCRWAGIPEITEIEINDK